MTADRPYVATRPDLRFGKPNVAGISVDAIAEQVWAGEPVDHVAATFGLTREQVLVACWHRSAYRPAAPKLWTPWADWHGQVHAAMARGEWDGLPEPPSRHDTAA